MVDKIDINRIYTQTGLNKEDIELMYKNIVLPWEKLGNAINYSENDQIDILVKDNIKEELYYQEHEKSMRNDFDYKPYNTLYKFTISENNIILIFKFPTSEPEIFTTKKSEILIKLHEIYKIHNINKDIDGIFIFRDTSLNNFFRGLRNSLSHGHIKREGGFYYFKSGNDNKDKMYGKVNANQLDKFIKIFHSSELIPSIVNIPSSNAVKTIQNNYKDLKLKYETLREKFEELESNDEIEITNDKVKIIKDRDFSKKYNLKMINDYYSDEVYNYLYLYNKLYFTQYQIDKLNLKIEKQINYFGKVLIITIYFNENNAKNFILEFDKEELSCFNFDDDIYIKNNKLEIDSELKREGVFCVNLYINSDNEPHREVDQKKLRSLITEMNKKFNTEIGK